MNALVFGKVPFVFQTQNVPGPGHVTILVRIRVTGRMNNIEIDGLGFQRQVTGLGQIVPANPADAASGGGAVSLDTESAVADTAGPENDDAQKQI